MQSVAAVNLGIVDWTIMGCFFVATLLIGIWSSKTAGRSSEDFFLSGRSMPWWLLGTSMVATTFAADTPNLVTDIVRQNGIAGNWVWWAFLLTGMVTVFVYAKLWRRTGLTTDIEFYELRYSGRPAAFLRGFRALYLGVFFNVIIMASVCMAAIKIGNVVLGMNPYFTLVSAALITMAFSALGGFKGVIVTDCLLFVISISGSLAAAYFAVNHPSVGGLTALMEHDQVAGKLSLVPDFTLSVADDPSLVISIFLLPLTVQWWAAWYPGSEPGGGGYIAQRMLAAKDENQAVYATLLFNVAHYAVRPWPWILVALASLIVYPDVASLREEYAGQGLQPNYIKEDLAYSAMLQFLPPGWIGVVMTSLVAAFISTLSTHLNWGSSYVTNDFYKRFVSPDASQRELVWVGRVSTISLMALSGLVALLMTNAKDSFDILLGIGAGTGLVYLLRWFWWRVNAWSEISAMIAALLAFIYWRFCHEALFQVEIAGYWQFVCITLFTTLAWVGVTLVTLPVEQSQLCSFYKIARPGGPGWRTVIQRAAADGHPLADTPSWSVPSGLVCMTLGCIAVYSTLFGTGYLLAGQSQIGGFLLGVALVSFIGTYFVWGTRKPIEPMAVSRLGSFHDSSSL